MKQAKLTRIVFLLFMLFIFEKHASASPEPFIFSDTTKLLKLTGSQIQILEDKAASFTFDQVKNSTDFVPNTLEIPNLGVSPSAFWIKFSVRNSTNTENLLMELAQATIDTLELYSLSDDGSYTVTSLGEYKPYKERLYDHPNFIFNVNIPRGAERAFYLRVHNGDQSMAPLTIGTSKVVFERLLTKDWIFGIFFGIVLVMTLYNLFIYFTVRDKSYLFYVVYIILVGLLQVSLHGYTFKYLWPGSSWAAIQSVFWLPSLTPIAAVPFFRNFLQTKKFAPGYDKALKFFMVGFVLCIILSVLKIFSLSFLLIQLLTMGMSFSLLVLGVRLMRKGYRPAKFFLLAWSIFLMGVFIFILKDFGILPNNDFTFYMMPFGAAFETVLLSFALADKINILRKEKEESQEQALQALEENARIVSEQNVILETKVNERTEELQASNKELNKTLKDLKEAEMQLVESEKMASLGQLTAGIAHEINNPINFVTSNVRPLKRDVEMIISMLAQVEEISLSDEPVAEKKSKIDALKQEYDYDYLKSEIDYLLNGINEGSSRTAEIVKGLRIFSRLDEDDLKKASINEGIDSTIVIINNLLDNKIEIIRKYGNVPLVECYPGKLNQVFLNMITNAIHALKSKFKDQPGGTITISTYHSETTVSISIADNGTGMDEKTKQKLFEPFFTTKEVGEGTGLGLSIAYNTIKKHNGTIEVNSAIGEGTEFIIEIPIIH